jgi:hypothetical protein
MLLPDGSTLRLGEDIRRARFRNSAFKQELLKPNQIVEIPFEFYWMARRKSSEIRTGCANERPSGSVRGVPRTVVSLPGSR